MAQRIGLWRGLFVFCFWMLFAVARAGETPKKTEAAEPPKGEAKPEPGKKDEAKPDQPKGETKPEPTDPRKEGEVVAKVDGIEITRAELTQVRRQLALNQRGPLPSNDQLLDQLIDQVLLQKYFDQERLNPGVTEIEATIRNMEAELRQRGASYQQFLQSRGLSVEEHAGIIRRQLASQRLVNVLREKITPDQIKAEYEAHPDHYDGSRARLSQIYVDTRPAGTDAKELEKGKEKIDKIYGELTAGKDFDRLAADYSAGGGSKSGGADIGWYTRKGANIDEKLIEAVWPFKVGEYTKPLRNALGWHILKVTEREGAYFTFQGCKEPIIRELVRRRIDAMLKELRDKAKIEKMLY